MFSLSHALFRSAIAVAVLGSAGCQVRGLIGSNESATVEEGSSGIDGVESSETFVATSAASAMSASGGGTSGPSSSGPDGEETSDHGPPGSDGEDVLFDVQPVDDPEICAPPVLASCDDEQTQWYHALGLGCDGDDGVSSFASVNEPGALLVYDKALGEGAFKPREGQRMVILSTGRAAEVPMSNAQLAAQHPLDCEDPKFCPSSDLGGLSRQVLPDPINPHRVDDQQDCKDDPRLIGMGDCSNSLAEHWTEGDGAYDYVELRLRTTVPEHAYAFQYDFAFFSSEYPLYTEHGEFTEYNDMYIAWLDSESWTGNVSFDDEFNPITVQSVFLDHRSASEQCPTCDAPELEGFSMESHAGTRWLTTKAPVSPGEKIELVFALFDLSDPMFDSVVVLDNFQWTCSDGPPVTWAG